MKVRAGDGSIIGVRCNKCGGSCDVRVGAGVVEREGLIETTVLFGYGSQNDGDEHTFSLCEACLLALFSTFQIAPDKRENVCCYRDELNPDKPERPERVPLSVLLPK